MPDLRELMENLVAHPVAAGPAVEEIGRRARARRARRRRTLMLVLAVAVAAGPLRWAVSSADDPVKVASEPGRDEPASPSSSAPESTSAEEAPAPGSTPTTTAAPASASRQPDAGRRTDLQCKRGYNGGATDVGVTGSQIAVHMRATLDGPRKSLLEDAPFTVKKAVDEVNRNGGICGRLVSVTVVSDSDGKSWHQPTGDMFAGLVGPWQAGFEEHIADGTVDRMGLALVGTDGLTQAQYRSELVWPVGTSAAGLARIAVDHAYRTLGARTFAMAYDSTASWSREAEAALRNYVTSLPGASVRATTGLDPNDPSYSGEAEPFNQACNNKRCDVMVLALLPETAKKWLQRAPAQAKLQTVGLPFLLTDRFAEDCTFISLTSCDGFRVWTGFVRNEPNPMLDSAEIGIRVLIEALKRVGPNLTRARLQQALAETTFASDLADTLDWNPAASGHRGGNVSARAYDSRQGAFQDAGTGWVKDPAAP